VHVHKACPPWWIIDRSTLSYLENPHQTKSIAVDPKLPGIKTHVQCDSRIFSCMVVSSGLLNNLDQFAGIKSQRHNLYLDQYCRMGDILADLQ
jgi:hypothetical protein